MDFANIKKLVHPDLTACQQLIMSSCDSNVPLINDLVFHLINRDGKLMRPLVTILCSYLCGYNGSEHIKIAAAVELMHTATLMHDDIIDNATMRRGQITANYKWNNDAAVLAGDFLLAKSSQIIANLNNIEILKPLAIATVTIVEGEMLQLVNKKNVVIDENTYLKIITCKTAKLFEMAAMLPAILANCHLDTRNNIATYGLHLGIAFQLIDDLLDYQETDSNKLGKAEELLPKLQTAIARSGAIAYTISRAKQEVALAKQAISTLTDSAYKDAANSLLDFIISRES